MMVGDDDVVEIISPSPPQPPTQGSHSLPQVAEGDIAVADEVEVLLEEQGGNFGGGDQTDRDDTDSLLEIQVEDLSEGDDVEILEVDEEEVENVEVVLEEGEVTETDTQEEDETDMEEPTQGGDQPTDVPDRPDTPLPPDLPDLETYNPDSNRPAAPQTGAQEAEAEVRPVVPPPGAQPSPARAVSNIRNSQNDFRSPKRRKLMSPVKPAPAEDDDADSCPICFEAWENSGKHRLASLRCGHLFGQSCIEKWLRGQGGKCPHCNAKAKRQDIRVLYAKALKTVDTTERDRALEELEKEKDLRKKADLARASARLHYQLAIDECNRLRTELDKVKKQLLDYQSNPNLTPSTSSQSSQGNRGQFRNPKVIKMLESGGCRVLAYSSTHATLVISQPSTSQLFPGYGVKKLNAVDFKSTQYMKVHSKPIRDMSFHPVSGDGFLLSGAMDKTVKLTNLISNTVIQSYDTPMPVWSCVWNADDRNYFYAGQQNGTVLEFDVRNTQEYVQQINTEGSRAPIVSLQYVPVDQQATFRPGGLLVGQLDRITFYEKKLDEYKLHLLPADGNLTSLYFEPQTRHILTSFRPTAKHPTVRHMMSELTCRDISTEPTDIETLCSSNAIQTFHGGRTQKVLSKTVLLPSPSDNSRVLTCAGDESSGTVHVWDGSNGHLLQKLPAGGTVVDMCDLQVNSQHYLATLTEKSLTVHQWT